MRNRKYYEKLYERYPDLVTLNQFRKMLGGIGECTARKLVQQKHIKSFKIRGTYMIPKACVIDYVLSSHYLKYRNQLSVWV